MWFLEKWPGEGLALTVPANVAFSTTFHVQECVVSAIWAEVAYEIGAAEVVLCQTSLVSKGFVKTFGGRMCEFFVVVGDGAAPASVLFRGIYHVISQGTGNGIRKADDSFAAQAALVAAPDAHQLVDDMLNPLGGREGAWHAEKEADEAPQCLADGADV